MNEEQASREQIQRLEEIAEEKGYDIKYRKPYPWFVWDDIASPPSNINFSTIFDLSAEHDLIRYPPGAPNPKLNFLRSWGLPWEKIDDGVMEETADTIRTKGYVSTKGSTEGMIEAARRSDLFAERDALWNQLKRSSKRLREPFEKIENVLKVFANETADALEEGRRTTELLKEMKSLWLSVTGGRPKNEVRGQMKDVAMAFGTPSPFSPAQSAGVFFHLATRDQVIESTIPLHSRWLVYEAFVVAELRGEKIPSWEELKDDIRREGMIQMRDMTNANEKLNSAKKSVAKLLLVLSDGEERFELSPAWEGKSDKALFERAVEHDRFERDGPAIRRQIVDAYKRRHDGSLPPETGATRWFEEAKRWANEQSMTDSQFED